MTDLIAILKADYQRFPKDQTFSIYAENVYFKDPLTEFRGRDRYKRMIQFISRWFVDPQLDLHSIQRSGQEIRTEWTLMWTSPLPWKPRITIEGWSELQFNTRGFITSHIDYWRCSRLDVLKQHLPA